MHTVPGLHGPEPEALCCLETSETAHRNTPHTWIFHQRPRPTEIHSYTVCTKHSPWEAKSCLTQRTLWASNVHYRVHDSPHHVPCRRPHIPNAFLTNWVRRDSSVDTATRYGLHGPGIESPGGGVKGFRPLKVQTGSGAHPGPCPLVSFPAVKTPWCEVNRHLMPRLRMSGATPLFPLYAFVAWTGKHFRNLTDF